MIKVNLAFCFLHFHVAMRKVKTTHMVHTLFLLDSTALESLSMLTCSFIDLLYKYHLFSHLSVPLLWRGISLQVHFHFSSQLHSFHTPALLTTLLLSSPCHGAALPRWPVTYKLPLLSPPLALHSWSFSPWNAFFPWLPGTQCSDFPPAPGPPFLQPFS